MYICIYKLYLITLDINYVSDFPLECVCEVAPQKNAHISIYNSLKLPLLGFDPNKTAPFSKIAEYKHLCISVVATLWLLLSQGCLCL